MIEDSVQSILKEIKGFKHLRSAFVKEIKDKEVINRLARLGYVVKSCPLPNKSKLEW